MSKNKFGIAPIAPDAAPSRERSVGPMGAAVREAVESLAETTEAKVEQRRRNAEDAKSYRAAQEEGRVLVDIPLSEISTTDLPRDRLDLEAVATSDEMEELKASIRARGQKEPVEVYRDGAGAYQLKKGWRRFTALSQLLAETGDARFAHVTARVELGSENRLARYIDMVEENTIREDLTFAEMAQLAITAAHDAEVDEIDPDAMVARLYGALHKMKRSYIRKFVFLLVVLGDALKWPRDVPRNLGVDVARLLNNEEAAEALRERLRACATPEAQNKILAGFIETEKPGRAPSEAAPSAREKFEFRVGSLKVTARQGECRITSKDDYASVPRDVLERAIKAFEEELRGSNPRVTPM